MDSSSVLIVAIIAVLGAAVIGVLVMGRVQISKEAEHAQPAQERELVTVGAPEGGRERADEARREIAATKEQVDPETIGITRRQFLNRAILTVLGLGFAAPFGLALLEFLWPSGEGGGGFGGTIKLPHTLNDILDTVSSDGRYYAPDARCYVVAYPKDDLSRAEAVYSENIFRGMEQGVVALYQKCPHLGCRVPFCDSSQWFECPCHGSKYNRVGEKKAGPAPRGMDRFPVTIEGNSISIDTGTIVQGPTIGTDTTNQAPAGPLCV